MFPDRFLADIASAASAASAAVNGVLSLPPAKINPEPVAPVAATPVTPVLDPWAAYEAYLRHRRRGGSGGFFSNSSSGVAEAAAPRQGIDATTLPSQEMVSQPLIGGRSVEDMIADAEKQASFDGGGGVGSESGGGFDAGWDDILALAPAAHASEEGGIAEATLDYDNWGAWDWRTAVPTTTTTGYTPQYNDEGGLIESTQYRDTATTDADQISYAPLTKNGYTFTFGPGGYVTSIAKDGQPLATGNAESTRYMGAGLLDPRFQSALDNYAATPDKIDDFIAALAKIDPMAAAGMLGQINDRGTVAAGSFDPTAFSPEVYWGTAIQNASTGGLDYLDPTIKGTVQGMGVTNDQTADAAALYNANMTPEAQSAADDPEEWYEDPLTIAAIAAGLYFGVPMLGEALGAGAVGSAEALGAGAIGSAAEGFGGAGMLGEAAAWGLGDAGIAGALTGGSEAAGSLAAQWAALEGTPTLVMGGDLAAGGVGAFASESGFAGLGSGQGLSYVPSTASNVSMSGFPSQLAEGMQGNLSSLPSMGGAQGITGTIDGLGSLSSAGYLLPATGGTMSLLPGAEVSGLSAPSLVNASTSVSQPSWTDNLSTIPTKIGEFVEKDPLKAAQIGIAGTSLLSTAATGLNSEPDYAPAPIDQAIVSKYGSVPAMQSPNYQSMGNQYQGFNSVSMPQGLLEQRLNRMRGLL